MTSSKSNYGGRLGRIINTFPRVSCPLCGTRQVQIINYTSGDPKYRCRHCKQIFTLQYKD
ncbi:hypothetical protein AB733_21585 [Photobacterium swingsii]|nr:hypothetical protein AB733_21585 [Photobacterium swingsii]